MTGGNIRYLTFNYATKARYKNKERAMNITNSSHIQSFQNIQGLHQASAGKGSLESIKTTVPQKDTVSFSEEALRLSDVAKTNPESTKIRFDLVNRVKSEIAAGTYDTPDKMDTALERMASRIFS
jgi:anti-sigma28 factor (negative regulator of flagellin synthesis)